MRRYACTYVYTYGYVHWQLSMSTLADWVWQQLLDAGCDDWISKTPKRFDTWLPRPTGGCDGDNDGFWWIPNQTRSAHIYAYFSRKVVSQAAEKYSNTVPFSINKLNKQVIALVGKQEKFGIEQCLMELSTLQYLLPFIWENCPWNFS